MQREDNQLKVGVKFGLTRVWSDMIIFENHDPDCITTFQIRILELSRSESLLDKFVLCSSHFPVPESSFPVL